MTDISHGIAGRVDGSRIIEERKINHKPIHLHSMLVHAVLAFAPLAAVSFVFDARGTSLWGIEPEVWKFLLWGSLIGIFLISLPATLTGISERNHMYVNWSRTHRAKLLLSMVLLAMVAGEIVGLASGCTGCGIVSILGLAIVVGNNLVALVLSYFGLRITLGRQSFASTSYVSDMDHQPPVDILEVWGEQSKEEAKVIDVQQEGSR